MAPIRASKGLRWGLQPLIQVKGIAAVADAALAESDSAEYRCTSSKFRILQEICKNKWAFWHILHHLESVSRRFYWPMGRPIPSRATTQNKRLKWHFSESARGLQESGAIRLRSLERQMTVSMDASAIMRSFAFLVCAP